MTTDIGQGPGGAPWGLGAPLDGPYWTQPIAAPEVRQPGAGPGQAEDTPPAPTGGAQAAPAAAGAAQEVQAYVEAAPLLSLQGYPRPGDDNARGMHWIPTVRQSPDVVDRFVREAREMGVRWMTFLNDGTDIGANDHLVRRLVEAGIMPILRVYSGPEPLEPGELEAMVRHYKALGVPYFQLYNEPNLRFENGGREPDPAGYAARWLPAARAVIRGGGLPGLGALSPGGDYNDLEFFDRTMAELVRRGGRDVLGRTWVAVHNYGGELPVTLSEQQEWGFGRYRAYDDIVRRHLGRSLPIISTEGGVWPQGGISPQEHARQMVEAYRLADSADPYYFAYTYWVIANEEGGGHDPAWRSHALFQPGWTSPLVQALKSTALGSSTA